MIIYNVTVNIEATIQDDWVKWMKTVHIPDVIKTGCFTEYRFTRVLTTQPDETGFTYSIQYSCPDLATLERYQQVFAPALQAEHSSRYEGQFVAFRTLLQEV